MKETPRSGSSFAGCARGGSTTTRSFVVFGDHGEAFGEHPGNFAHTLFIHEENVRVPYVIAAPGRDRRADPRGRVASVIDTAPTMLDLLGLPRDQPAHQGDVAAPPESRAWRCSTPTTRWDGSA